MIAQVLGNGATIDFAVLRHRGSPDIVFVEGLALKEFPKTVLTAEWVNHLALTNVLHKVLCKDWQVDESIAVAENLFAHRVDSLLCEFLRGRRFKQIELSPSPVLEVLREELHEGHDLAQIKLFVQVEVEGCAEVVNRQIAHIRPIPLTVVDKVSHSIKVVLLEALFKEFSEEARVYWGERLATVLGQLDKRRVGKLRLACEDRVFEKTGIDLGSESDLVIVHLTEDESKEV